MGFLFLGKAYICTLFCSPLDEGVEIPFWNPPPVPRRVRETTALGHGSPSFLTKPQEVCHDRET